MLLVKLGGNGKGSAKINREITEIDKSILDGLFRILLQDSAPPGRR
jgi:flagellar motor switch protein FliM